MHSFPLPSDGQESHTPVASLWWISLFEDEKLVGGALGPGMLYTLTECNDSGRADLAQLAISCHYAPSLSERRVSRHGSQFSRMRAVWC